MDKGSFFVLGMLAGTILFAIFLSLSYREPKAIDVYQGKTTLKYTVIDGMVKDSTVVFKGEE